ncbi:MAG: alpha/beta fold hydrolase [Solirubrobacteraceae bacterium]
MRFLFENESFSFEALRTAGQSLDGGADLGEVITTCDRIADGDIAAWHIEWKRTAERVHGIADACLASGATVSAREAYLRATNYYRTAEFFRRESPVHDQEIIELASRSRDTFGHAIELMPTPVETVTIPYEDTTLPGYLFLADDTGAARPTVIVTGGFDSPAEEAYFVVAAAALRRGYNVLAFDGPGQGSALRAQRLVFRHDWEHVIAPVVDFLCARAETDTRHISLLGYSLGGLLAARAAAFESRLSAIALYDGMYSFYDVCTGNMPPFLVEWIEQGREDVVTPLAALLAAISTQFAWGVGNGCWTFGVETGADFIRATKDYTLEGIAEKITCPTLVMNGESDHLQRGQAQLVFDALTGPKELVTFLDSEGAGEHCQVGAMGLFQQRYFDWLDTVSAAQCSSQQPAVAAR